jgi:hypothetical protein
MIEAILIGVICVGAIVLFNVLFKTIERVRTLELHIKRLDNNEAARRARDRLGRFAATGDFGVLGEGGDADVVAAAIDRLRSRGLEH